jgi:hypothetical protein
MEDINTNDQQQQQPGERHLVQAGPLPEDAQRGTLL